jgi:hypothetical protein
MNQPAPADCSLPHDDMELRSTSTWDEKGRLELLLVRRCLRNVPARVSYKTELFHAVYTTDYTQNPHIQLSARSKNFLTADSA